MRMNKIITKRFKIVIFIQITFYFKMLGELQLQHKEQN